jgi:hypothetical protein
MTETELKTFREILEKRQSELAIGNREALAVEASPDEMDRIQHFSEREYAMNHLERSSSRPKTISLIPRVFVRDCPVTGTGEKYALDYCGGTSDSVASGLQSQPRGRTDPSVVGCCPGVCGDQPSTRTPGDLANVRRS